MTREEAIERLNIHKSTSVFVDSIAEAIDMAIEALQADAVSRDVYDKRTQADEEIIDSYRKEFQKALQADAVMRDATAEERASVQQYIDRISAEAVQVVRCKDCRHIGLFSCPLADNDFQKDEDFCSWGERREP